MIKTLFHLLKIGNVTQTALFPDLPEYCRGLPSPTGRPCADGCAACEDACPTAAIAVSRGSLTLDRGRCIACGACVAACESGALIDDRGTKVATASREALVLSTGGARAESSVSSPFNGPFRRSLHYREVSTGDNASDLEVAATNNPIFDASRFGVHVVASPRHADALVVTGPVARAMREPLLRCHAAMAEPRIVIAVGASAISGAPHCGGYAEADGVGAVLKTDIFVPGHPPHPWYILHGLLLAMGREIE
jgi:Ni,Fe-hydrogenase III small subunit/formate hydrogenlyase subunit 6/NADH:ubiquinone oxidoreductase subunit I